MSIPIHSWPSLLGALTAVLALSCSGEGAAAERGSDRRAAVRAERGTYEVSWDGRAFRHGLFGISVTVPPDWTLATAAEAEHHSRNWEQRFQVSTGLTDTEIQHLNQTGQVYFTAFRQPEVVGELWIAGVTLTVTDLSKFPSALTAEQMLEGHVSLSQLAGEPVVYGSIEEGFELAGIAFHRISSRSTDPRQPSMRGEVYTVVKGDSALTISVLWSNGTSERHVRTFLSRAIKAA